MATFSDYTLSSGPSAGQKRPFLPLVELGDGYVGGILFASPDVDGLPAVQYVATREGDAPGEVTAAARTSHTTSDQGHFQVHAPEAAAGPSTPPLGTDANIPTPPAEDAAARSSSNKGKKD